MFNGDRARSGLVLTVADKLWLLALILFTAVMTVLNIALA